MSNVEPPVPQTDAQAPLEKVHSTVQSIARRQWWLWSAAVLITILLTIGIASFAFPSLLTQKDESYTASLDLAVRSLIGLVLLFIVYVVYQQLQIQRMQHDLKQQLGAFGRLEDRTEQVYKIAALDGLTGLYNRQCGEQRLMEEMSRSQRHGNPLTILLVDLNELKRINDTFGHAAGDLALRYFAERLQKAVRGSDVPIRLGGDEFLILLPDCKLSEVHLVLNRLKGLTVECEGQTIPLEFAAGWTNYIAGEAPQVMMRRADELLYANKRAAKESSKEKTADGTATAVRTDGKNACESAADDAGVVSPSETREREVIPISVRRESRA